MDPTDRVITNNYCTFLPSGGGGGGLMANSYTPQMICELHTNSPPYILTQ